MIMGRFWSFSSQLSNPHYCPWLYCSVHITFLMAFLLFWMENFCIIVTLNFFFCNMVIKGFKWHPIQKMASFCHPHLRNICPINWVSSRIAAPMNGHFFRAQQAAVVYQHCCDLQRFYSVTVLMFWTIMYGSRCSATLTKLRYIWKIQILHDLRILEVKHDLESCKRHWFNRILTHSQRPYN